MMDDLPIFEKAASLLGAGESIALVTVVATTGSTPGKAGCKMLVWAEGRQTFGTVGGGLVEAEMVEQAGRMLSTSSSKTFRFDLGAAPDDEKGICGGSVEHLIETFDEDALPLFQDLVEAATGGEPAVVLSLIAPDALPRKTLVRDALSVGPECSSEIVSTIQDVAAGERDAVRVSADDIDAFVEGVSPPPNVILLGAGHVSYHVARYAKGVHFRVTVYDDRGQYANRERFPNADAIIVADFEQVLDKVRIDPRSYVVIVTRGHQRDEIVLEQALKTEAKYIGMIGSKRKTRAILDRLKQRGVSVESLDRVFSPIGISVGAVTPEEIALSIVCELVKIRRLGRGPGIGHLALCLSGGRT